MIDTLLSPTDIIKNPEPLHHFAVDDLDIGMFKEVLRENGVYDVTTDRTMCRIGNKDIEVDVARDFKAAAAARHS